MSNQSLVRGLLLLFGRADCDFWAGESEMIWAWLGGTPPRGLWRQSADLYETMPGVLLCGVSSGCGLVEAGGALLYALGGGPAGRPRQRRSGR